MQSYSMYTLVKNETPEINYKTILHIIDTLDLMVFLKISSEV